MQRSILRLVTGSAERWRKDEHRAEIVEAQPTPLRAARSTWAAPLQALDEDVLGSSSVRWRGCSCASSIAARTRPASRDDDVVARDVHVDGQLAERVVEQMPFAQLTAGAVQNEVGEVNDQAGLSGKGTKERGLIGPSSDGSSAPAPRSP
jgi:hypothetical protein